MLGSHILQKLVAEKLVTEPEAGQIRTADAKARQKTTIMPSQWLNPVASTRGSSPAGSGTPISGAVRSCTWVKMF